MSDHISVIWKDLPQEERDFIQQMLPFCADGNPYAAEAMLKFYQQPSELQPARLYYGVSIDDPLACLILGRYHLHGYMLFHRNHKAAELLLMKACQSNHQSIAQEAERELMVLGAGVRKTFELSVTTLNEYTGSEAHVVVPPAVRAIGHGAFRKNLALESVVLPSCLEVIEYDAFKGCKNLRTIRIPDSVWRIEEGAFESCEKLEEVILPKGLCYLGPRAFSRCKALTAIDLPGGLGQVENWTFDESGLTKAVLRPGIRSIGSYAFYHTPLKEITLPESLERIEAHAFARCEDLASILWYGTRHLVGQYELKRDNEPFKKAAEFFYDLNYNRLCSSQQPQQPIYTSPHFPPRDINKETYYTGPKESLSTDDAYLSWIP